MEEPGWNVAVWILFHSSEQSLKRLFVFHDSEFLDIFCKAYSSENRSKGKWRKSSSCRALSGGNASVRLRESSMRGPTHKQSPCQSPCQSVSQSVSKPAGQSIIQPTTHSSTYPANQWLILLFPSHPPTLYTPNSPTPTDPVPPPLTDAWQSCRSGPPSSSYTCRHSVLVKIISVLCVSFWRSGTFFFFPASYTRIYTTCCGWVSIQLHLMKKDDLEKIFTCWICEALIQLDVSS